MRSNASWRHPFLLAPVALAVILGLIQPAAWRADAAVPATPPSVVALPTVQINGVAWQQAVWGDTVYAGGSFSTARPAGAAPGTNTVKRQNMLAFDINTGELKPGFVADTNGQVLGIAMAPDGSKLYIVGEFTKVNGIARPRIAALDPTTGAVDEAFNAGADFRVRSLYVTKSSVFVGGRFNVANGQPRANLAAFRRTDGALLNWAPRAMNGQVMALARTPNSARVVVAGSFNKLNGVEALGLGAVSVQTGATMSFPMNKIVKNGTHGRSAVYSLHASNSKIYGTGYTYEGGGNFEGTFATDPEGNPVWLNDSRGDQYDIFSARGITFAVGHAHRSPNVENGFPERDIETPPTHWMALALTSDAAGTLQPSNAGFNFGGKPAPRLLHWYPHLVGGTYTGQNQAAWTVGGNDQYIVIGGEFPRVSGTAQQGLVRFGFREVNPQSIRPNLSSTNFTPDLTSPAAGVAQISWLANWDRDDERLTYTVEREGAGVIGTYSGIRSNHYERPVITHLDKGLVPGQTYRYRITAYDPSGNVAEGEWASETISASGTLPRYVEEVLADRPQTYRRLGESSGSVVDRAYTYSGAVTNGVKRGVPGAIVGDRDKAYRFTGGQTAATNQRLDTPRAMSTEAWIKTTSSRGGMIVGWGDKPSGASSLVDYVTYLGNDGRIRFTVDERGKKAVTSPKAYNDGKWHHVVSTLDWWSGQRLYVDGVLVASNPAVKHAQDFYGYWRIGGDNLAELPGSTTSDYFNGDIDEVSTYLEALPEGRVAAHYAAGIGG